MRKHPLEQNEDAITDYDAALRLKPDLAEAYINRGIAKAALNRHGDAIADYDQAIRSTPDYAEAYCKRGTAKAALGLNDEALEDFETALKLARNAGNAKIVAQAEQSLSDFDATRGS